MSKDDNVKSPSHYKLHGLNIESINIIQSVLFGAEVSSFGCFCIGNILKYVIRAERKNGLEDYKKARVYLDWLIETLEEDDA